MATAGIEQLVAQYVKGDRNARRDLFALADRLGVDLLAGQKQAIKEALTANHEAILKAYVDRQYDKVVPPPRVLESAEGNGSFQCAGDLLRGHALRVTPRGVLDRL